MCRSHKYTIRRCRARHMPARPGSGTSPTRWSRRMTCSAREGFPIYIEGELYGAKWHDWKYHIIWEPDPEKPSEKPAHPYIFNITVDPKEETPRDSVGKTRRFEDDWMMEPILKTLKD